MNASDKEFLDNQTRLMKKGTQQFSFGTYLTERRINRVSEFFGIPGREVSEPDEFTVRPDGFNRVEFRGVRRQPLRRDVGFMLVEKTADNVSLVSSPVVHDEDTFVWNTSSDTAQEFQNFFGCDITRIDTEEKIESFTLRGDTDSADNREPVMPLPMLEDRSPAFRRPGLSDDGLKHKTGLVNEDDRLFFPSWPVVLSLASSPVSILPPALRSVPSLCAGAFGSSSLRHGVSSTHDRDDTLFRTSSRLHSLFSVTSITGLDTQKPRGLSEVLPEGELFALGLSGTADVDGAGLSKLFVHPFSPSLSSDVLMKSMNQPELTLFPESSLALTASSRAVFVFPTLPGFLWVSYRLLYMHLSSFRSANINK